MAFCALCDIEINDENNSKEHIIPNSIGGRKTIKNFLCRACNNKSGQGWDAELANQYKELCLFLDINKQRGSIPSVKFETEKSGTLIKYSEGFLTYGKPSIIEEETPDGTKCTLTARTLKEAKTMLGALKKKHPSLDIQEILNSSKITSKYVDDALPFTVSFGGMEAGRSIVKTCLALAKDTGIEPRECVEAINYLCKDGEACFGYYYENDLVENRNSNELFHCVSIHGNPETKQLLGYVEYFSSVRMVICLSSNYNGPKIQNTYGINPLSGEEITLEVSIPLSPEDIKQVYSYEKFSDNSMGEALSPVMALALQRMVQKEKNRIFDEIEKEFLSQHMNEEMTDDLRLKLHNMAVEKLAPFISHQQKLMQRYHYVHQS